jgi:hypothetical protein
MKRIVVLLIAALMVVTMLLPSVALAQGPFTSEAQAEAYWASTGYPVCYPGGNGYYWDGYYWVWYPCQVY